MRLTLYSDYALRVLLILGARPGELVTIHDIARTYRISEAHLTKVAHRLGALGFIETVRGRNGGLRLTRSIDSINIGEVVRATEPDFCLVECFAPETNSCPIMPDCLLTGVLGDARDAFLAVLDKRQLSDLRPGKIRFPELSPPPANRPVNGQA